MPYTFLVVDDERLNRSYIRNLITDLEPNAVIHEARSAAAARDLLASENIDILFLDIKMPGEDGMQFLSTLEERVFELVITTAYSEYAIKAIKEGAIDYLLKPVKITEFKEALYKAIKRREQAISLTSNRQVNELETALNHTITIHTHKGTKFAMVKHIVYIQADNTYTTIFMSNGEKIITTRPIIKFEETLDNRLFFRIHKSYIINCYHFKEHISKNGDIAAMDNGARLAISRYRLKAFLEFIQNATLK
ncbi:LytTR family DNA-binding domain-containing protein [Nemorincola caseinilytica]|uniref:LytTR family DNA-binding domain-containing protein n=1 Tax=Nemorincola caseinilytica TaxID=2054315 RepID=A0ABP8NNK5_9BACT